MKQSSLPIIQNSKVVGYDSISTSARRALV